MLKTFNPEYPVVVGFAGGYCTGKTATAERLCPMARLGSSGPIHWDHLSFAGPLHEMANIKRQTFGQHRRDRIRYEILRVLVEVLGKNPLYGAPSFEKLIQMVEEISDMYIPYEGKPREFLQKVGTEIVRGYDKSAWVLWMHRKIMENFALFNAEQEKVQNNLFLLEENGIEVEFKEPPIFVTLVSDCRFKNEMEWVKQHPNGILIRFTASPEVVKQRDAQRELSGSMTESEAKHVSETEIEDIPEGFYDYVVDTDDITVQEQAEIVKDIVYHFAGVEVGLKEESGESLAKNN